MVGRIVCLGLLFLSQMTFATDCPSTYFNYSQAELDTLKDQTAENPMSLDEVRKWDSVVKKIVEDKQLSHFEYDRIFSYLYVAQEDAATLSQLQGSLDPVSDKVIAIFIPNYSRPTFYSEDGYSLALGNLIASKVKARVEEENQRPMHVEVPAQYKKDFSAGKSLVQWRPWFAVPENDFLCPRPPRMDDPIWKEQIKMIKKAQDPMTIEKKEAIYRWAGLSYPWSDDWRSIVNQYLYCRQTSLKDFLAIRSAVAVALYDTMAACWSCKYDFFVPRPKMYDPTITYIIPPPKHPSYPSGHSTTSMAMATVMAAFFPSDANYWYCLAENCGCSRIWAGIHYPIDHEKGQACGKKIGEKVVENRLPCCF